MVKDMDVGSKISLQGIWEYDNHKYFIYVILQIQLVKII